MESTNQKTFTSKRKLLSVAAAHTFVLLICPVFSAYGHYKVVGVTDVDRIKFVNISTASIIRSVDIEARETSKKKMRLVNPSVRNQPNNLPVLF
jgi:hypothetical protein